MSQDTLLLLSTIILLLPLFGFVVQSFFGKKLPRGGGWFETGLLFIALILSLVVLFNKLSLYPDKTLDFTFRWVDFKSVPGIGPLQIDLGLMLDNLAATMLVVVTIVSAFVHLFSIGYMAGDVRYSRYFGFLGLFSFSMLGIVLTNNFFTMYVSWELVGLSSYLLIGHWYEKKSGADAGKKAFIVNRIGDIGFFTGIMILFTMYHTFNFDRIFSAIGAGSIPFGSEKWLTAAGLLVFAGAVGKSAQFPLHVWLPDAMEGPTPVSALIHAATMVAAGVYLIARTYAMMTADALLVIAYVGVITAVIGATIAIVQTDIKRVLAYSTISQLGYMMLGLGVGAYSAGMFHLMTHAWFKAGLFLGSGSVIHAMHNALHEAGDHHTDAQDIRNMGGLRKRMPITFWTFLIFTLAISGVPFTSGFLSKDEILAGTLAFGSLSGHYLLPILGYLVAGLTAFYMFRLVILTFFGDHADSHRLEHVQESGKVMAIPLIVLAVLSVFIFYSLKPFGASSGWYFQYVERPASVVPLALQGVSVAAFEEAIHNVHILGILLSLFVAGLGILLAYTTYYWKRISADEVAARLAPIYTFLQRKWYFDELYHAAVVRVTIGVSRVLRWFDDRAIDGLVNGAAFVTRISSSTSGRFDNVVIDGMVNLIAYITGFFGLVLRKVQTGKVQTYIVFVILGVMVFFFIFR
jgi:NADH-quinone oxidoreductase subunit L